MTHAFRPKSAILSTHIYYPVLVENRICIGSFACTNKVCFIPPGANTQSIEAEWMHAKAFVKSLISRGPTPCALQDALDVYMWRKWCAAEYSGGAYARILNDIRQYI